MLGSRAWIHGIAISAVGTSPAVGEARSRDCYRHD